MFGFRLIFMALLMSAIAGAGLYVMKLRSDNAILKANQIQLDQQKKDFEEILQSNRKLNSLINVLQQDLKDLDKRFNKKKRDIGKLAVERAESIERIINKGAENAARCIELASGAPHTEEELKATTRSKINPECPALANPSYVPYE